MTNNMKIEITVTTDSGQVFNNFAATSIDDAIAWLGTVERRLSKQVEPLEDNEDEE